MPVSEKKHIPVYCNQCVSGPDLMKVEVEGGIAKRIAPNYDIREEHPGGGRVCVKAYGLIQKTYNPNRVKSPMKRTNPEKGREHDPGFVPISWDEALTTVTDKLNDIRGRGLLDESGYPRVAVSLGAGGTPVQYMGSFAAFLSAWGSLDMGYGAGQGVKCHHSEHLYGELWHRAFIVAPDTPYCNYVISCGMNVEASGGVAGIWRHADARVRGLKRVQVEPHLSVTGAVSAEWIPIKPKTDAAFLYALIHRILHERNWREVCDVSFLEADTNAPYLIGPHGYYLRDPVTREPLVYDPAEGRARPHTEGVAEPALEGSFECAGIEEGADGETWSHNSVEAQPAFAKLIEHVRPHDPDWAAEECDIPAERIRRVADEYLSQAGVGETLEIEGRTLPLRPVAVLLGKNVNSGWGGYQCCWARTMLLCLVGALEVPGGMVGTNVKLNRPASNRLASAVPGPDGFMHYPFNETTKEGWQRDPTIRNAYSTLVPLVGSSPWSPALGPAHLPWLFQKEPPKAWPKQTNPEIWFCYRTNPAISSWDAPEVAKRVAEFPFTVAFAYTHDETNHMADILLPEATDLESLQLIRIGNTKFTEQFWRHEGWAVRQPVGDPVVDCRDMTDIATELAQRTGLLKEYNAAINRGAAGMKLRTEAFDYALDEDEAHPSEEVWDRVAMAASHEMTGGTEVHGIEWFKEHGYMLKPFPQLQWYLYPHLKDQGLRFEQPYQERLLRHGKQLANRLHEVGIDWWDKQAGEHEALPAYHPFPQFWIDHVRDSGHDPDDYPFWGLTARSMQYSWGANVGIPVIAEVARNVAGHKGVVINREAAKGLGIEEGDPVVLESVTGMTEGHAVLREGIRPDTVLMIGQFDHWATPFAKDLKLASLNSLTPLSLSLTDGTGSGADLTRLRIRKGKGAKRRVA